MPYILINTSCIVLQDSAGRRRSTAGLDNDTIDSSQCRNSDEQIGRTCSNTSTPSLSIFAEQSVRELNAGLITCLVPRSQPPERRPAALAARPRDPGG